jgi:hypothetical protein
MNKEWLNGSDGHNLKFKRETLLNYGMNRWGLNKAYSVGPTSELIRTCAPKTFEEWEEFYFNNARQKKKEGIRITREDIIGLGQTLYIKISEVVRVNSIQYPRKNVLIMHTIWFSTELMKATAQKLIQFMVNLNQL